MAKMGFRQLFLDNENPNGYIVTSFIYPNVPQFVFKEFYKRLSDAGIKTKHFNLILTYYAHSVDRVHS